MEEIFTMASLERDQTLYTVTRFLAFVLYFSIELCHLNGQVSRPEPKFGETSGIMWDKIGSHEMQMLVA